LNHTLGGIIDPLRPVEEDSSTLTSAFGATADMAGPVAGLVAVENDPLRT
jgi:hypothetical protein